MNNILCLAATVVCLSQSTLASAETAVPQTPEQIEQFDLHLLVGFGNTFVSNGPKRTYGATQVGGTDRVTMNAIFGAQILKDIAGGLKLGVEMNFSHWLNETTELGNHPMAVDQDAGFCFHGLHMAGLMEFKLSELFRLQAGFGMYATLVFNNEFGTKYGGSGTYFMIAPGVEIPVNEDMSIPISLRVTTMEMLPGNFGSGKGFGGMIPITLMTGVNL